MFTRRNQSLSYSLMLTKSRNIDAVELSKRISCRNRSRRKALRERYPASRQRYHRFLFLSRFQLVIAFGSISSFGSSVTDNGCMAANTEVQLSSPCVTLRLKCSKSEYRFQTPTVSRNVPSQKITRNCAYFPCFLDFRWFGYAQF